MNTLPEAYRKFVATATGDMMRDLSELGLAFPETWEASGESLTRVVEKYGREIPVDLVPTLFRNAFIEGVCVGVAFERGRR